MKPSEKMMIEEEPSTQYTSKKGSDSDNSQDNEMKQEGLFEQKKELVLKNKILSIDYVIEEIEKQHYSVIDNEYIISLLNKVSTEGESIISLAISDKIHEIVSYLSDLKVENKMPINDSVYDTIQSTLSYTEMPMNEIRNLIGNIYDVDVNEFGVE